jgi:hypothetical protein
MKTGILILLMIFGFVKGFSQNQIFIEDLPDKVHSHLHETYNPDREPIWYLDEDNYYSAVFTQHGNEHEVFYSENGNWVQTNTAIHPQGLPVAVIEKFNQSDFAGWVIEGVYEIRHSDYGDRIIYEMDVSESRERVALFYDQSGNFIKMRTRHVDRGTPITF